jgi:hypothetical protein
MAFQLAKFDCESDSDDRDEINVDEIKLNIIRTMNHLIFCDLTTGRTDNGLEPYDFEEVNEFISENSDNIQMAASIMFAAYEEGGDISSLKTPCTEWFREYLDEFVTTPTGLDEKNEDDDGEYYGEEDNCDDEDFDDDE